MKEDVYQIIRDHFLIENTKLRKDKEIEHLKTCANLCIIYEEDNIKDYMNMLKHYSESLLKKYGYAEEYYVKTHRFVRWVETSQMNNKLELDSLILSDLSLYDLAKYTKIQWPI